MPLCAACLLSRYYSDDEDDDSYEYAEECEEHCRYIYGCRIGESVKNLRPVSSRVRIPLWFYHNNKGSFSGPLYVLLRYLFCDGRDRTEDYSCDRPYDPGESPVF